MPSANVVQCAQPLRCGHMRKHHPSGHIPYGIYRWTGSPHILINLYAFCSVLHSGILKTDTLHIRTAAHGDKYLFRNHLLPVSPGFILYLISG